MLKHYNKLILQEMQIEGKVTILFVIEKAEETSQDFFAKFC